ncbi:MAG TPA: glucose 1-dehydrogenase [Acidobacteriaceae bacterium]|jgi:glucose 1-dehydrogenase|nr:glucose 1-dehydrogenase [Acidobacteriaceae bacterium]
MPGRFAGKVAVVTGSSSGIGQAIAVRLASEGAAIVIDYRSRDQGAQDTENMVKSADPQARFITIMADVTKIADTNNLIQQAWSQLGSCDILINNAGVEKGADFWDVTEEDYDLVLDVNLKGAFFLTQAFVRKLRDAKKPGRIINISSVHEDMVFPHFASYSASKGGLRMLMRNLSVSLGPLGITVNNVAPGAIVTPINNALLEDKSKLDPLLRNIPLGRMGTAQEVAGLVAWLASDEAAYVTGSTYFIDGGLIRNYHEQ